MVILKLVAWADQGLARDGKDAVDLFTLLKDYHDVLGLDALYDEHSATMEAYGFVDRRAAAHVLGERVARQIDTSLRELFRKQFQPGDRDKLLVNMIRGQCLLDLDAADELLGAFEQGIAL